MANNLCTEGVKGRVGAVAEEKMGSILEGLKCPARTPPKGLSWGVTLWALCFSNVTQQLDRWEEGVSMGVGRREQQLGRGHRERRGGPSWA